MTRSPVRLADLGLPIVLCVDHRHPAYFHEVEQQIAERQGWCFPYLNGIPSAKTPWVYEQVNDVPPPDGWAYSQGEWNHLRAFRTIVAQTKNVGCDSIFFLEDDALFTPEADRIMAEAEVPDDWELLYLGAYHCWDTTEEVGRNVLRLNGSPGSHAVAIRSTVYDAILAAPLDRPTDGILTDFIHPRGRSYCLFPAAVVQKPGISSITMEWSGHPALFEYKGSNWPPPLGV